MSHRIKLYLDSPRELLDFCTMVEFKPPSVLDTAMGTALESITVGDPEWDSLPLEYRLRMARQIRAEAIRMLEEMTSEAIDDFDGAQWAPLPIPLANVEKALEGGK